MVLQSKPPQPPTPQEIEENLQKMIESGQSGMIVTEHGSHLVDSTDFIVQDGSNIIVKDESGSSMIVNDGDVEGGDNVGYYETI